MSDPNKLCPGCMGLWADHTKPCPSCGFSWEGYERAARWLPPRTILCGKYMVGKVIGEGGFGITYLGWDLNLQVRVAIKEYFPIGLATRETGRGKSNNIYTLSGDRRDNYRQGLEKFMEEAQNLSRFYNLKGIVAVKDFFFENETAYMVMEYVDGITLGTYLKQHGGQISEQEVLQLFHPVISSLQVVHQAGIIHRDISPDNIMMTKDGRMKLIDFGAARFAGGDDQKSLTIILKHGYAPGEQYQSRGNQGPWTDVYALCATMYRMLTGKVPPSAMDRFHEDGLEEFKALGCNVSDKTAYAVIDKGMALKVADRYQNMQELLDGLYGIQTGKVKRIKKKNTVNLPLIIGLGAAGACLLIGLMIFGAMKYVAGRNGELSFAGQSGILGSDQQMSGEGLLQEGNGLTGESGSQEDLTNKIYTEEELAQKRAEAAQYASRISGADSHLVFVQEDGSVKGVGTDSYDSLSIEKWSDISAVSTSNFYTVGLKEDGTIMYVGSDSYNRKSALYWKNITQIEAGDDLLIGICEDGTIVTAGASEARTPVYVYEYDFSGWSDIVAVAAGTYHVLGLKADGSVLAAGMYEEGAYDSVEEWTDVAAVAAGEYNSIGLKKDGTVLLAGQTEGLEETADWEQIVAVTVGDGFIAGLKANGQVLVAGSDAQQQKAAESWQNVKAVVACDKILFGRKEDGSIIKTTYETGTVSRDEMTDLVKVVSAGPYIAGLKKDGTAVTWGMSGDSSVMDVSSWTDLVDIAANSHGVLGLKEDGTAVVTGVYTQADGGVDTWTDLVDVEMTAYEAIGIKSDGTVYRLEPKAGRYTSEKTYEGETLFFAAYPFYVKSFEDRNGGGYDTTAQSVFVCVGRNSDFNLPQYNELGSWSGEIASLAVGYEEYESGNTWSELVVALLTDGTVETRNEYRSSKAQKIEGWENITEIACGAEHIVGLRADGTVAATGSNDNGQCEVSDWTDIVSVSAGEFYTMGVKADGTLIIAGKVPGEY